MVIKASSPSACPQNLPRIGMAPDWCGPSGSSGGYSAASAWYALRVEYTEAVRANGGCPLLLPYAEELAGAHLDLCHGLLVAGGDFDPDPALYGATPHPTVKLKPLRTQFELALLRQALERRMPVLGICGGMQLLNVVRGGSLVQDIPSCWPGALEHRSLGRFPVPTHPVRLDPGSALARIVGSTALVVNTSHHQAVDRLGEGLVACAWSEDEMVEAIEDPAYPFCMGTQWHPEYRQIPQEDALMQAFLEAARAYQGCCG